MTHRTNIPLFVSGLALGLLPGAEAAALPKLVAPSEAAVAELLARATPGHPRLCADAATFPRIVKQASNDPRLAGLIAAVVAQADAALAAKPVERILEGRRLLGVSRTALLRLTALGAAWRLTGEDAYAQRGERELQAICAFSDWHPEHFLDVGEMTLAVAFGYDWLFEALSEPTRAAVRQAIVSKGVAPSYGAKPQWWVSGDNNWCQVCHTGLMAGVLAISEEEPALAARVVQRAVANLPKVMAASFAPDGAYPEGPMYWEYGTTFNLIAIDLLRMRLGQDFGLAGLPGFAATADYIAHVFGPTGRAFNYSDCSELKARSSPAVIWFARERQHDWQLPAGQDAAMAKDRLLALSLAWAGEAPGAVPAPRPLDYHGGGHKPVAMFRSAWNDPDARYLGVTAGIPSSNHGHMDVGSFVFEAKGVRWATDLGMQDYNSLEAKGVDLWKMGQDSQRWTVFRLNQASHNVLVLGGQPQQVAGVAAISHVVSDDQKPGCTIDLTPVYAGQATKVERRLSLPQRASLVVEDTITGVTKSGTIRWQFATRAAVVIAADGRRARLTQDGKTMELTVASPDHARLVVADAVGHHAYDVANPGVRMLAAEVAAEAGATVAIRVTLDP